MRLLAQATDGNGLLTITGQRNSTAQNLRVTHWGYRRLAETKWTWFPMQKVHYHFFMWPF